jgi:hypothetical protein
MNETNKSGRAYTPIKPVSEKEKLALEQCDAILDELQRELRGDCKVEMIRNQIKNRLTGYV